MGRMIFEPKPKGIKKWYGELKKEIQKRRQGVTIEGIKYIKMETGESVFADYRLLPVVRESGLYKVEEMMMSEKSYRRKMRAAEIKNEIEKEKYLAENPVNMQNTRRFYITADYSVIKQLRDKIGIREQGKAVQQFCALVERERIKKRIAENGNKIARAIYEAGAHKEPRIIGYIGGLKGKKDNIERVYNLKDARAQAINQDVFEELLRGDKRLRDYYEEGR